MANLYKVVWSKSNKEGDKMDFVQATSQINAVAAVAGLSNYKQVVSVTEVGSSNIIVGS